MQVPEMIQQQEPAEVHPPWYRQFWPWVLIAIPLLTVIASGVTFWLAVSNPDYLVVEDQEYQQIKSELRAQDSGNQPAETNEEIHEDDDGRP